MNYNSKWKFLFVLLLIPVLIWLCLLLRGTISQYGMAYLIPPVIFAAWYIRRIIRLEKLNEMDKCARCGNDMNGIQNRLHTLPSFLVSGEGRRSFTYCQNCAPFIRKVQKLMGLLALILFGFAAYVALFLSPK